MKPNTVALVARADTSRTQIAKVLRDGGYEVLECDELAGAAAYVVIVDADASELMRAQVEAWLRGAKSRRVVIISSKPSGWKALSMAHNDEVYVLAAPSFGWEIIEALQATPPPPPHA